MAWNPRAQIDAPSIMAETASHHPAQDFITHQE
jgi:hypothetical protein